jgi:type II secretory pathway pseudopilin PulG/uncharacterized protein (DUF2141 family)
MNTFRSRHSETGFTLMELMVSILVLGFILVSFAGLFVMFQRGSAQTKEHTEAQQNTRVALDFITDYLRQAGSHTDYFKGQSAIVYAEPYQLVMNADIDNGRTIDGNPPLTAIDRGSSPNRVTPTGATLYMPGEDYDSDAETILFTLDSSMDGTISANDRNDDPEENNLNNINLFVLKMFTYGFDASAGSNDLRESSLALIRGPNLAPTWIIPQPLFQYYMDHDDNLMTPDRLFGDTDNSGELDSGEIMALTAVPANNLNRIRRVKVTAVGESNTYDQRYETNGGFLNVTMTSEVAVRNISLTSSMIRGVVYHDVDSDGVLDPNETGLYKVEVRLAGHSRHAMTDNFGRYFFPLTAGDYSVQEVDPPGYGSTTANLVSISLSAGETEIVNFGDISTLPTGVIKGTVFEDLDKDGIMSAGEDPIPNVLISLDNGAQTNTNAQGVYSFIAQKGTYTVVETDPVGYSSTTPNSGGATIAGNDTVNIDFGDFSGEAYGTIEGYVFNDENGDGILSSGEYGIPNTTLTVSSGDSTVTNARGFYSFNLPSNIYSITERDPVGYTSTTVNTYLDIPIVVDTVVVRNFGDIIEKTWDYVEIHISNTERVLSVAAADLKEDALSDDDIVLGTALAAGIGNMLVFHNNRVSNTTPVTELFDSEPNYRRDAGNNINAMDKYDFSGDHTIDIVTGLDDGVFPNILEWFTGAGGVLSVGPDRAYITSGLNEVMSFKLADFNLDGNIDLLTGLKSPIGGSGAFEIFMGSGGGNFASWQYVTHAGASGEFLLAEVWAVEAADFDGDGDVDIVVGTHVTNQEGFLDFYQNKGYASGSFAWHSRYLAGGAVNAM